MLLDPPTVGGFLPRDDAAPSARPGRSAAAIWSADGRVRLFRNARSALALGVPEAFGGASGRIGTLWRPSFLCRAVEDAAEHARRAGTIGDHHPYPLLADGPLEPDATFLGAALRPGDAVLVVAFFGRPPGAGLLRLARARPDVTWIEDRAAAALPGPAWGDGILYSPRKILPVPDGGLLVLRRAPDDAATRAARRRHDHVGEDRGDAGTPSAVAGRPVLRVGTAPPRATPATFAEHRAREAAMAVEPGPPARATAGLLRRLDLRDAADRRRTNFAALHALLPPGAAEALLDPADRAPGWAPLGLPVLVPDARAASAAMAARGVFCAVLWPGLAAPGACRRARALANRVLLLPCDQRHAPSDMARVAEAFRSVAR